MKSDYYFEGIGMQTHSALDNCLNKNQQHSEIQKEFNSVIAAADQIETKQEKLSFFEATLTHDFLAKLESNQLMRIYTYFRDLGAFDNMINLYNNCDNIVFKDSIMVKELLMVAYNKCTTPMPDETIALCKDMIENNNLSGDVCGALGKAYLLKSKQAQTPQETLGFIQKSASAYEVGFAKFLEFYPGINAVYRNIDLNNLDKAKKLSEIVYLSCLKSGSEDTKDYWCAATTLEAACIGGKSDEEIAKCLNYLLKFNVPSWQFETTRNTLNSANSKFNSKQIALVLEVLDQKISTGHAEFSEKTSATAIEKDDILKARAVISNSYNYRGLASNFEGSSSVSGNFKFGGQLPDHSISRKDIELFDELLKTPIKQLFPDSEQPKNINTNISLSEIDNIGDFIKAVDTLIRYHFGTENFAKTGLNLENNAEINNSIYDQAVDALISLSGKKGDKLSDSRTNISSIFALGIGDCRHHAQVKQILFDRWQDSLMKQALTDSYHALTQNDTEKYNKGIADFYSILRTEMRTVDAGVHVPIKITSMYNAQKNTDNKYVSTSEPQKTALEEHTMNILIQRSETGALVKFKLTDAFYQNNYNWGNLNIDVKNIKITEDGKYKIPAGLISGAKIDTGKAVPITLEPVVYAGRRDVYSKDEHANNVMILGIPFKITPASHFISQLKNRPSNIEFVRSMTEWNNKKNGIETNLVEKAAERSNNQTLIKLASLNPQNYDDITLNFKIVDLSNKETVKQILKEITVPEAITAQKTVPVKARKATAKQQKLDKDNNPEFDANGQPIMGEYIVTQVKTKISGNAYILTETTNFAIADSSYIVKNPDGEVYVVKASRIEDPSRFTQLSETEFMPVDGAKKFVQTTENIVFTASWGEKQVSPAGSYLCIEDLSDIYSITNSAFESTYTELADQRESN